MTGLTYSDGARLGMCISQVKEDWRTRQKYLSRPDKGGTEVDVEEFKHDVVFLLKVVQEIERDLTKPVEDQRQLNRLNFKNNIVSDDKPKLYFKQPGER